jgi:hypothetical protein
MIKSIKLTGIVLILFICACRNNSNSTTATKPAESGNARHIRKSLYSKDVQQDADDLKKALAIMRKMDCDSTSSWYYQGAMHWVPDTILKNPFCSSYTTAPKDLKEAWDNCTHTPSGAEEIHFLVWHRLYIYHFEKIIRKLSGDPNFSLPYWGYTDTTNIAQARVMPAVFRDTTASLYEKARLDSINKGYPIRGKGATKLSLTKLFKNTTYAGFNSNMDAAPHGAMHNYIGYGNDPTGKAMFSPIKQKIDEGGGLMQDVATAAFDPIFWVHHANIDRVWQQWTNSPNGKKVTLDELNSAPWVYTFFDENGKKVVYSHEEIIKIIYNMGYDYDDTKVSEKSGLQDESKTINLIAQLPQHVISSQKPNVTITKSVTTFKVQNNLNKALLAAKDTKKPLFMKVTVSFIKPPKGSYEVYLNLPANVTPSVEGDYFEGFMTFFGAGHHMKGMANMPGARITKSFTFEITGRADALTKPEFNIEVLKFGGLPQEEIKVENVIIFRQ